MFDEVDDPLQSRVMSQTLNRHFQRPVRIQCAGKDLVANGLFRGQRLAGDRALITHDAAR